MRNLLPFKIFEAVYIGKIGLSNYEYVFNPISQSGYIELTSKEGNHYKVEVKSNGEPTEKKGDLYNSIRIFSPENSNDFDIQELTEKLVYILNKNRLGHKFNIVSVEYPKYGLLPYGVVEVSPAIKMEDMERLIASTKQINNLVKKGGDYDQFTF